MAFRRSRVNSRSPKRMSTWVGVDLGVTIPANSAVLIGVFNAAALALRPATVVRFRALLHVLSDQAAVTESPKGAVGAIIVSSQATTAGIASIPDPIGDPEAPWFFWEPWALQFNFLSSVGFDGNSGNQRVVDSKSMRKINDNEDLAIVASNSSSSEGAIVRLTGRLLLKLH